MNACIIDAFIRSHIPSVSQSVSQSVSHPSIHVSRPGLGQGTFLGVSLCSFLQVHQPCVAMPPMYRTVLQLI